MKDAPLRIHCVNCSAQYAIDVTRMNVAFCTPDCGEAYLDRPAFERRRALRYEQ